jgi:hypothetical protein
VNRTAITLVSGGGQLNGIVLKGTGSEAVTNSAITLSGGTAQHFGITKTTAAGELYVLNSVMDIADGSVNRGIYYQSDTSSVKAAGNAIQVSGLSRPWCS